jgi:hypothetical protein
MSPLKPIDGEKHKLTCSLRIKDSLIFTPVRGDMFIVRGSDPSGAVRRNGMYLRAKEVVDSAPPNGDGILRCSGL